MNEAFESPHCVNVDVYSWRKWQKIANHYLKIILLFCDDIVADIASNATMFPFFKHFQCQKSLILNHSLNLFPSYANS